MTTKAETEAIRARLAEITQQADGVLTPQAVVAEARNRASPLHGWFVWDDTAAAEAYRLIQARALITSVKIVVTTEHSTVQTVAYVRNPDAEHLDSGYVTVRSLRDDKQRARAAIIQEFARVAAIMRRAREIAQALGLDGEVDHILEQIEDLQEQVMKPQRRRNVRRTPVLMRKIRGESLQA